MAPKSTPCGGASGVNVGDVRIGADCVSVVSPPANRVKCVSLNGAITRLTSDDWDDAVDEGWPLSPEGRVGAPYALARVESPNVSGPRSVGASGRVPRSELRVPNGP